MQISSMLARFARDRSAAAAILFALGALPLVGIVGLGVDYFNGLANKTRLDTAADAAAIAAITAAQSYIIANGSKQSDPQLTNNAVAAGQAQAQKVFYANAGATYSRSGVQLNAPVVQRSGQTLTMTVSYTGANQNNFGQIFGVPSFRFAGQSSASLTMGLYLDFYLMLDMSGSMALPTSNEGQMQLAAINPDERANYPSGCQFACHFPGKKGYDLTRTNNIALRVDSVGKAVQNLLQTANQTRTIPNQYRIGLYPFIVNVMEAAPLSSNFSTATTVAQQLADVYLDNGLSNPTSKSMGSGGTHFENVFPGVYNYVKPFGNGSSPAAPKAFVFIVTDGVNNNQTYSPWTGSQPARPTNFGYCQYAQSVGVTVAILHIPYKPILNPDPGFSNNEGGRTNAVLKDVPTDLQACASPGFFFTANTDADIDNAMQTMFAQALKAARLTK